MSKAKVIHKDGLFVRKDKSRSSEWVRIIPCGEEFEFYEEYNGWLKVADGWVVCSDVYIQPVEVTGGSASLPFNYDALFTVTRGSFSFDGNTEGLLCVNRMYKISDEFIPNIPGARYIVKETATYSDGEFVEYIPVDQIFNERFGVFGNVFFSVSEPVDIGDFQIPETGMYVRANPDGGTVTIDYMVVPPSVQTVVFNTSSDKGGGNFGYNCDWTFNDLLGVCCAGVPLDIIMYDDAFEYKTIKCTAFDARTSDGIRTRDPKTVEYMRFYFLDNGDVKEIYYPKEGRPSTIEPGSDEES